MRPLDEDLKEHVSIGIHFKSVFPFVSKFESLHFAQTAAALSEGSADVDTGTPRWSQSCSSGRTRAYSVFSQGFELTRRSPARRPRQLRSQTTRQRRDDLRTLFACCWLRYRSECGHSAGKAKEFGRRTEEARGGRSQGESTVLAIRSQSLTVPSQSKEAASRLAASLRGKEEEAEAARLSLLISEDAARKEELRLEREKRASDEEKEAEERFAKSGEIGRDLRMKVWTEGGERDAMVKLGLAVAGGQSIVV